MKVKTFYETGTNQLEQHLNAFIKDKYVYDIKISAVTHAVVALVMYDDEEETNV